MFAHPKFFYNQVLFLFNFYNQAVQTERKVTRFTHCQLFYFILRVGTLLNVDTTQKEVCALFGEVNIVQSETKGRHLLI